MVTGPLDGGSAANALPIRFNIRVTSVGIAAEKIGWDPIRRCIAETLARNVLLRVWNRLGPRTLMELKKRVAPNLPADSWCELFKPSVIDSTALWEEIRTELIRSVVVDLDLCFQSVIWPSLKQDILTALTASEPSTVCFDAVFDNSLQVDMKLAPFVIQVGSITVRSERQLTLTFDFTLRWNDALEVCVCLGE